MKSARVVAAIASLALAPVVACSDPPSEPAQGALTVTVLDSTASGPVCQSTHGQLNLPADTRVYDELMSCDLSKGCKPSELVVVNRAEGADVQCTVRASGDGYQVSLMISRQPYVLLQVTGNIGPTGGTVTIGESAELGGGTTINDTKCNVSIQPNVGTVKPGAIWARFTCDNATVRGDPSGAACKIEGAFIFENCES